MTSGARQWRRVSPSVSIESVAPSTALLNHGSIATNLGLGNRIYSSDCPIRPLQPDTVLNAVQAATIVRLNAVTCCCISLGQTKRVSNRAIRTAQSEARTRTETRTRNRN